MQDNPTRIGIEVRTSYLEDRSEPDSGRFAFSYRVTITNEGPEPAQLLNRHWVITSDNGRSQEVRGAGVIGEQPHLQVGQRFVYTSWTMLETATGQMHGGYQFVTDSGETFWAEVPAFILEVPGSRTLH